MRGLFVALFLSLGCANVPAEYANGEYYAAEGTPAGASQLYLVGPVTTELASKVATGIIQAAERGDKVVVIHIDSPGGSVYAGQVLSKIMEAAPLQVVCKVDGMAASMAFYLLQSCDLRLMTERSILMAHEPSLQISGRGNKDWFKAHYEELLVLGEAMGRHQSRRLKITHEEFMRRIDNRDWNMDSTEALEVGAVDAIVSAVEYPRDSN